MIGNYSLEQQNRQALYQVSFNSLVSAMVAGGVAHKYNFDPSKAAFSNLAVDAIEIIFIRLLNNPPLTFTGRIAVRTLCVAVVTGTYTSTRPEKKDVKAVGLGAIVGSITNIAMDLFRILISDDPSFVIANKGFALSIHDAIETSRILNQAKHAVG